MRILRASFRLLYLIATIALIPPCLLYVALASLLGRRGRYRAIMAATPLFGYVYLHAFGVRMSVEGRPDAAANVLVGNHVSYLDIFVGAAATGAVFVSRHDVKHWPLFGWFARMAGTVFIDRSSLRSAIESSRAIVERASDGARITLFPEGGILPGEGVKAFKPFLLAAAAEAGLAVQPFAITYTHFDGRPIDATTRDFVEWHDTPIHTHAWRIMKSKGVRVHVAFGTPMTPGGDARVFVEELRGAVAGLGSRQKLKGKS
jgi:1-acyl-sn-glycerol-3-phosphate acyltransferase